MNITQCNDRDFGPVVHNCRGDFDFTLVFEDTILSIAPSTSVLVLAAGRILYLRNKPKLLLARKFQLSKLTALAFYVVLQIALTVLWTEQSTLRSWSSIVASSLSLFNAFIFCSISYLEHARSIRPSSILIVYLFCSALFDLVRCRTLWLMAPHSSLTRLFTASVVFKALVLVLESTEKAKYLPANVSKRRPEETSSVLNRGVFYWLNRLMLRGSRHILVADDLYELGDKMTAEQLGSAFLNHWRHTRTTSKYAAILATSKTLKWPLLAPIFPRVVLLSLTICQPVILHKLLTYLSAPVEATSIHVGYGLIGAYALVYSGTALATGFYWYKHYQFLTMVRGCLVSAISWRTVNLNVLAVDDPKAAVTLMSTDVERVTQGLRSIHDFWASIIQISVALYLLRQQMGTASVVPIVICVLCAAATAWGSGYLNKRQAKWMEAVQARLGLTSAVLASMKGVKLRGLTNVMTKRIHSSRYQEITFSNQWRLLSLVTICLSFVPEYLSPVATFTVYIIQARVSGETFDVARAFTTLSLLAIMTEPLTGLLQSIPALVSAIGCFERIGTFVSNEEQRDFRDFDKMSMETSESQNSFQIMSGDTNAIELKEQFPRELRHQIASGQPVVRITQGCFGWVDGHDVLKDIDITIPSGSLTCIIGPVASGKSTLCQTLLGETRASKGQVELSALSNEVAFCHQTAHVINGTIRENIIRFSISDAVWYETVLRVCGLQEDISALPKQHDTIVGSGGVNLSGGQRQKVAIARAIYARKAILILDDVFSGFDAGSEHHVFQHAIGPNGLARKLGMTIIFATHAIKFLPHADHIVALGSEGRVLQEGAYTTLQQQPGYVRDLAVETKARVQGNSTVEALVEMESVQLADKAASEDLSRQVGDFAVYRYYLSAAGILSTILMLIFGIATSIFVNLPTLWLKWWTDASSTSGSRHDYMYLGIYGTFECLALVFLILLIHRIFVVIVAKTGLDLHSRLLHTVANASLLFFSTTDSGAITNRFSQDLQLIETQLSLGLLNLTFSVFVATGQIILIIASSPWIGLAFPFILLLFYFVQSFYLRTSRQLRFLDLEAKSPLYTNFLETLSGLATIRAFGWTKQNLALNHKLLDHSQKPVYLLYMIQRWLTFVLDMIVAILAVTIAALAVLQRANSGFAGVALTQVMLINLTLRSIIIYWTEVETSIGSVSRIKNFSETTASEHKLLETNEPSIDWPQSGKVEFREMNAIYETAPDEPALRKLDLSIRSGEKIGICGRSGSGKSSLVLALFRMLEIQSGSLKIDDIDLAQVPRDTIRDRLNVIPQETFFLPGSVRVNLDPRGQGVDSAMIDALKNVQLWSIYETRGGLDADVRSDALSHGQRQLFSLASATLRKSKIVVLDEATSNVDHETDKLMQHVIRTEFRGCTIIAVAHRLNTIMDFDRIAVLHHGTLCELDSPQALLSRDSRFRSMWGERGSDEETSQVA